MRLLVSFADGPHKPRAEPFRAQAQALGAFDRIEVFDTGRLPRAFVERHRGFLHGRGFGYFIWKPVVIAEALSGCQEGDLVTYLDAGFTLNPGGRSRMEEYFEICRSHEHRMLSFQNVHTENMWTKADLAVRLGVLHRPEIMATSQLTAGFVVVENTRSNRDLIHEWAALAVEDGYHLSDDSPSVEPNHPGFQEHRHDQSISSLLRKLRGTAITHYEVQSYAGAIPAMQARVPAWATRLTS